MDNCNFCLENNLLKGDIWLENDLFYSVSVIDEQPRHAGMIIPKRHIETPFEFNPEEWQALQDDITDVKALLDRHKPDGYNLGWNVGTVGGQHIMHVHLHIIPRFADDPWAGSGIRKAFKS